MLQDSQTRSKQHFHLVEPALVVVPLASKQVAHKKHLQRTSRKDSKLAHFPWEAQAAEEMTLTL